VCNIQGQPGDRKAAVGIMEKMWAVEGSIKRGFIALHGEAWFIN
jgi:hypothetical protein